MTARAEPFDPDHPQPGEPFQVAGARVDELPLVTRKLLALDDGDRTVYLVEANDRRLWTLEPRDEHDGVRFVGRPRRDD